MIPYHKNVAIVFRKNSW